MNKQLAFVLGGGAARGALQVGALRALLEAGFQPDLLVGTSVGAANAAHLAVQGVSLASVDALEASWHVAATIEFLPANYLWLTLGTLLNRTGTSDAYHRMRDFWISRGLAPELRFGDIKGLRLFVVAADLNCGCPVVYGTEPAQSVLEAVLASAALPPWVPPLERGEQLLIDGGTVSNLPIEPALAQGATDIIALDLTETRDVSVQARNWFATASKLVNMATQRQMALELKLAAARGAPVLHIPLQGETPVALWDFARVPELIPRGYYLARQAILRWQAERQVARPHWFKRLFKKPVK